MSIEDESDLEESLVLDLAELVELAGANEEDPLPILSALSTAPEDEERYWAAWPYDEVAYEAFVHWLLAVAALDAGTDISSAVIDWVALAEGGASHQSSVEADWLDPDFINVGSCSRVLDDGQTLSESPVELTLQQRIFSLVTRDLPNALDEDEDDATDPTFSDQVILPLVELDPEVDDLAAWLEVFLAPRRGQTVAWVAAYAPGPIAMAAAERHGVTLHAFDIAKLPPELLRRHRQFYYLALTEAQGDELMDLLDDGEDDDDDGLEV